MSIRELDGGTEFIEHALVANNFVITIGGQLINGQGCILERVCYRLQENNNWDIVPDVSIVADVRKRTDTAFTSAPSFVMEIVGSEWERTACKKKLEVYRKIKVPECWVVDWSRKSIEIYLFAEAEDEELDKYLKKIVTESNKEELKMIVMQNLQISFEELFIDTKHC